LKPLEKLVVFAVGDDLPALDIISVIVPADFGGEFGVAFFGFVGSNRYSAAMKLTGLARPLNLKLGFHITGIGRGMNGKGMKL
jgi:hypothetical protein